MDRKSKQDGIRLFNVCLYKMNKAPKNGALFYKTFYSLLPD